MAVFRSREVFIKLYPTLHPPHPPPYVEVFVGPVRRPRVLGWSLNGSGGT